jgi:hypothetical protein
MKPRDEFRLRLGQIERRPLVGGEARDEVDEERDEDEGVAVDQPRVDAAPLHMARLYEVQRPRDHDDDNQRDPERDLVRDHLTRLAHGTVDGPLVVASPPRQDHSHHFEAQHREDQEQPSAEARLERHLRPERHCDERREHRREREVRREPEEQRVGVLRDQVFLPEQLDPVRERLEQPDGPDSVRPEAALHVPRDFPLRPDAQHRRQHDERKDQGSNNGNAIDEGGERRHLDAEFIEDHALKERLADYTEDRTGHIRSRHVREKRYEPGDESAPSVPARVGLL